MSVTAEPVLGVRYYFDSAAKEWRAPSRTSLPGTPPQQGLAYDWSDTNLPWSYVSGEGVDARYGSPFTERWPDGVTVANLSPTGATLYERLSNTLAGVAGNGRVVVRLPAGTFHLTSFRLVGSSGDPDYAFGFWFPRLQGLLGAGPDRTFVQMDADSMSQAQLDRLGQMPQADFDPASIGFCRIDGTQGSPALLAGLTFQAEDQQNITTLASDLGYLFRPQPAPHQGVFLYSDTVLGHIASYVRFLGAARALNSQPPFETANIVTGKGYVSFDHCESDGRRAAWIDPARPRRCGVLMGNSEHDHVMEDVWLHHSNVSRYAVNDQNRPTAGKYTARRCKLEQITNTRNTDPALNGGNSLGGFTNATPFGWESSNATILVEDTIVCQDNPYVDGQFPAHFQLTWVGNRNPQGGRMTVRRTTFRSSGQPHLDGYATFRIKDTSFWWTDGFNTTLAVYHPTTGVRLAPFVVTGSWPPTAATLAAAGVSNSTHYLIRRA